MADVEITEDTVLAFDFASNKTGEIHGIGFDNDQIVDHESFFQIAGSQEFGFQGWNGDYTGDGDFQSYVIPIGELITGGFDRIVLASDNDVFAEGVDSLYRKIEIYDL